MGVAAGCKEGVENTSTRRLAVLGSVGGGGWAAATGAGVVSIRPYNIRGGEGERREREEGEIERREQDRVSENVFLTQ